MLLRPPFDDIQDCQLFPKSTMPLVLSWHPSRLRFSPLLFTLRDNPCDPLFDLSSARSTSKIVSTSTSHTIPQESKTAALFPDDIFLPYRVSERHVFFNVPNTNRSFDLTTPTPSRHHTQDSQVSLMSPKEPSITSIVSPLRRPRCPLQSP